MHQQSPAESHHKPPALNAQQGGCHQESKAKAAAPSNDHSKAYGSPRAPSWCEEKPELSKELRGPIRPAHASLDPKS